MTAVAVGDPREDPVGSSGSSASEFVTFFIGPETFAVPLGRVKEIIRMPSLMRLPLAPASLDGITNLRGGVLPVLNLRRAFGLAQVPRDDATRVLVMDLGKPVGIVVDRMSAVESVDAARIDMRGGFVGQADRTLVVGAIRNEGAGQSITMILDIEGIVARECAVSPVAATSAQARGNRVADASAPGAERVSEELRQFVSFVVEGQEYALPIADVREIVHVPKTIAAVPNASPAVMGMVTLRDRLLPILSLRSLLGLPPRAAGPDDRIVVVSPAATGHSMTVGILTDAVREVLRIGVGTIDPMPPMLAADGGLAEISAVCRLDGGRRLVSVLDPRRIFQFPEIQAAAEASVANAEENVMTADGSSRASVDEEQVVVFKLGDEEFGVAIDNVQEIVRLPEKLIRVPNAPDFIEGIMNLRGTIVPLVDQRRRFRLPPMERNERQRVVVFTLKGVRSGFIVDSVVEVRRIARAEILPAPDMSDEQNRLIRRVANLPDRKRMIQILDVEELLDTREPDSLPAAAA
ncbi:hypothetical protein ASG43_09540 [Aureimonas sp. Leaf454]|uniref:chemotaxis protein CheW n=1 Tax=Aureimonas sp. Leaf454 TaxID=1736381 RepID=UPI0006FA126E|nr:chemotaxis protein CheW [Aureimonas sp. Leaf454]KQT47362.1 hypothetical protein ASG43_09540 [Aureimonas sp. Leaf454]